MHSKYFIWIIASVGIFFSSCNSDLLLDQKQKIKSNSWSSEDVLDFDFSIIDTNAIYDLFLEVEHSDDYPYQNVYVQSSMVFPAGQEVKQTVSLEVASKAGIWSGDCSGNSCVIELPLQMGAFFNQVGDYHFRLEQYSRDAVLSGVKSIRFKIKETGRSRK